LKLVITEREKENQRERERNREEGVKVPPLSREATKV